MAKRSNQKLKILYLAKILLENTSEQNGLTLAQILSELEKYGISSERKSLYDDIEALRTFGIDVKTSRDRYVKYYVSKRNFDTADIKIIFDIASNSNIMSERHTRELLKKFNTPMPKDLISLDDASVRYATTDDTYKNLSVICDAIVGDRKIRFKCFEWNLRKQKEVQNDGEYLIVSPLKLEFKDRAYNLICFNESENEIQTYRVSKILNVSVVRVKRSGTGMLDGIADSRFENVRLRCDNPSVSEVFEHFGTDVTVLATRDDYFEVSVKAQITNDFFAWIFTRGGKIKIIGPESVVDEYASLLKNSADNI